MKKKIAKIFDTYPMENSSYKAIFHDLDERGKLDPKNTSQLLLMLVEEVSELKDRVEYLEQLKKDKTTK